MSHFKIILVFSFYWLISCSKEDVPVTTDFSKGIFVVNEGPFNSGTGTITYRDAIDTIQDVFGRQNAGKSLGNIAQSMIKFDDKYYVSINNGAKIQVINSKDFKSVTEISGIDAPRFFATDNKKLYVSAWGKDLNSGKVYEINTITQKLSAPIETGGAPEAMTIHNDKLYVTVSTNDTQNISKKVIVIDIKNNSVIKSIETSDIPTAIVKDKNGDLWVLCSGFFDWTNPALNTNGGLHKITNDQLAASFSLSNGAKGLAIDNKGEKLFFLMDSKVIVQDITDETFKNESVYDGNFYSIGYHTGKGEIYLSDAGDFQSNGQVITIDPLTKKAGRFTAGIIPGFFYFVD